MRRTVQLPAHADHAEFTERQFQQQVIDMARMLGWEVYHPWLSVHSMPGWPDLALVKPPRLVLAELKSERGKATEAQQKWLALLGECAGVEVFLWRPSDLRGAVLAALR